MKTATIIFSLLFALASTMSAQTNLITNPGAENGFDGWVKTDGGSGWTVDSQTTNGYGYPRSGIQCWASSYEFCTLKQSINLLTAGYDATFLDASPDIQMGVYVRTNITNGGTVTVMLELCDENNAVISTHYICNNEVFPMNTDFTLKSTLIKNYGIGVRSINVFLIGKDTKWWAGYHGPAFDDAYLYLPDLATGVDALSMSTINVFPNPATNHIILDGANGLLKICDLSGRLLITQQVTNNKQVNVNSLSKGVYIIQIDNQQLKFVKN